MNNSHRKACSLFFATMVAVILALQANEVAQGQSKKDDISIGYSSPSGMFTPLFIAQERGLFKKYGLRVKQLLLLRGTGPAAAQMLVAGTAPIAGLGGALVEAGMHGGGLVYIASSNHLIFSLYSRPEIARPEELRGKTVAVDAKGGSIELATIVALKQFGLTVGKDVNAVYLGGPVAQSGAVDCNLCRKIYAAGSPSNGRRSSIPPRTHRVAVMKAKGFVQKYEENRDLRRDRLLVRTAECLTAKLES